MSDDPDVKDSLGAASRPLMESASLLYGVQKFLALLEADLVARPAAAVRPLPSALAERLNTLADELGEVGPKAAIKGEVSL